MDKGDALKRKELINLRIEFEDEVQDAEIRYPVFCTKSCFEICIEKITLRTQKTAIWLLMQQARRAITKAKSDAFNPISFDFGSRLNPEKIKLYTVFDHDTCFILKIDELFLFSKFLFDKSEIIK